MGFIKYETKFPINSSFHHPGSQRTKRSSLITDTSLFELKKKTSWALLFLCFPAVYEVNTRQVWASPHLQRLTAVASGGTNAIQNYQVNAGRALRGYSFLELIETLLKEFFALEKCHFVDMFQETCKFWWSLGKKSSFSENAQIPLF